MSIKFRLYLLVALSAFLFLLAAFTSTWMQSSVPILEKERSFVNKIQSSILSIEVASLNLGTQELADAKKRYALELEKFASAFANIETIRLLTTINQDMADSVTAVKNLYDLSADSFDQLQNAITSLDEALMNIDNSYASLNVIDIVNAVNLHAPDSATIVNYYINTMQAKLSNIREILDVSTEIITKNTAVIDSEISKIKTRSSLIGAGINVLTILLLVVLSVLIASSIQGAIKKILSGISTMSAGDLSQRFNLQSKSELGQLSLNLDSFLETLQNAMLGIKSSAKRNHELKNSMQDSVNKATSSTVEIAANSESIKDQMQTMDTMVQAAKHDVDAVANSMNTLSTKVDQQTSLVATSSENVRTMLESLGKIAQAMQEDRESAQRLTNANETGREVFEDSFSKIGDISSSIDLIQEMAEVIANIATQTNILAMNAAIEAAHAGDSGRGFAVVADEIGKLASASSASSQEIATTIRSIIDEIDQAIATKEDTARAFEVMSLAGNAVAESIESLYHEVEQIQETSSNVLSAMGRLEQDTKVLSTESKEVDERTTKLVKSFAGIGRISHEVVSNIGEISLGLQEINTSIFQVADQSASLGSSADSLAEAVAAFKLE